MLTPRQRALQAYDFAAGLVELWTVLWLTWGAWRGDIRAHIRLRAWLLRRERGSTTSGVADVRI